MANKNGITYYKLESNYDGDETKYCGLSGVEIDGNFYFLRGQDISEISWDKDTNEIIFTRVNGSKICISGTANDDLIQKVIDKIREDSENIFEISFEGTYFDPVNHELHLVFNGDDYVIDDFVLQNIEYTDETLSGTGINMNPLRVSRTIMSGFHLPAKSLVDISNGEELPKIVEKDDVYLTLENFSKYGLLYNFSGVTEIESILKDNPNGWRVPTSEEWGNMLNYLEGCDYQNHNSEVTNDALGDIAGLFIKSKDGSWTLDEYENEDVLTYKFNAYPTGYAMKNKDCDSFGKLTCFWTSDIHGDETGDLDKVYCRRLENGEDKVIKSTEEMFYYYSLRLVRDYSDTVNQYEMIDGVPYSTVLMPYVDEDGNEGMKVWTSQNVSFSELLSGDTAIEITDEDGNVLGNTKKYFINVWDGKSWEKRMLGENEIIMIADGPDGVDNEEWVLIDGELKRRSDIFTEIIKENVLPSINDRFDAEYSARTESTNELSSMLEQESINREMAIDLLQSDIESDLKTVNSNVSTINKKIVSEETARKDADDLIKASLDDEASKRNDADNALQESIDNEASERSRLDSSLQTKINNETTARKDADAELDSKLLDEANTREQSDADLKESITNEESARSTAIEDVKKLITDEASLRQKDDVILSKYIDTTASNLKKSDIKTGDYTLSLKDGLTLLTNDGTKINVSIDGDFGEF